MREMKDSGIEWIGEIPEDWEVKRIGSLYSERRVKVSDKFYPPLSVTKKGILPQLDTVAKTDAHDDRKLVLNGDFVINSRSDRRGSCGISDLDGSVSLINTVITPKIKIENGYYRWLFSSVLFADEFYKWGHGIVNDLWTTNWTDMKSIIIPYPSSKEQNSIATYLDRKCSEIDTIVRNTEKSIEEYKKLKQSLITEIVTGKKRVADDGLSLSDEPREMKDSGVEWIGEVPEEWEITRFCWINYIRARLGWKGLKAEEYTPTGYPFLSAFNIVNDKLDWSELNFINKQRYDESPEIKLSVGDILIVKDGAGIGKCCRIQELPLGESTVNSSLAVITPNERLDYNYLYYYLLSNPFQKIIWFLKIGMGVPHLTQEKMHDIRLTLPTKGEQQIIATYLDSKCYEIGKLISEKQKLLEEMETYKKSLIFECVTGKREVI